MHQTLELGSNVAMGTIGKSIERIEDLALLRGAGRFGDDLPEAPGCKHAAFLRSPLAHAKIAAIDISQAKKLSEDITIITGEDIRKETLPFLSSVKVKAPQFALAVDRVRYVGEPVAIVVAEDRYLAEDALELIEVNYTAINAVVDPELAAEENAPILHEGVGQNVLHERSFEYGLPVNAFTKAKNIIETTIKYPRNSCTPIETFVVQAEYRAGEQSYEVTANFQGPYTLHAVMSRALKVSGNRLRLKTPPDSGGSYGVKQSIFPNIVSLAIASKISGRPVKWVEDRIEHLTASTAATNRVTTIRAALNSDGKISALDYDQLEDCGAYLRAPEPATLYRMHGNMTGAYAIPNVKIRNRVVVTNKTPTGLMRGFGGPQVYFALERIMDLAANSIGLDPLEIRRRNLVPAKLLPFKTSPGAILDSGDYLASINRALKEGNLDLLKEKRHKARSEGRLYGIGYAVVIEPSISNMGYITTLLTPKERNQAGPKNGALATSTVSFDPSGSITVNVSSVHQGQGHRTVLAQVVADELGVGINDIVTITDHDTNKDPWSIASGNYSSRFAGAVAGATKLAAHRIAKRLKIMAAPDLNVPVVDIELADGKARSLSNPDNAITLGRVASKAHWSPLSVPEEAGTGIRETVFWTPNSLSEPNDADEINSSGTYGFVFDFCGVEVDPNDGSVRIDKYVSMHDAGNLLNPALADGQIRGGFTHGLGAALFEHLSYTPNGAFQSGTFADYCPPYATDVPDILILHDQTPSPITLNGAKGIGEGNCMSTPVCIANAVSDAIGKPINTLPLIRSEVFNLLENLEPANPLPTSSILAPSETKGGHVLQDNGSAFIKKSITDVWEILHDPKQLAKIIPGCHSLEKCHHQSLRSEVTLGAGPIKGKFIATVSLNDVAIPTLLKISGDASGPLGRASGDGEIKLTQTKNGTQIQYSYSMEINGRIAAVGARLLHGATRGLINQIFKRLTNLNSKSAHSNWILKILRWLRGGRH